MVIVFLFHCVDGTEHLGHGVQHAALRKSRRLLVTDGAKPEADKDVGQTEEAEDYDQSLQQVVGVKRVDDPDDRKKYNISFLFSIRRMIGEETYRE